MKNDKTASIGVNSPFVSCSNISPQFGHVLVCVVTVYFIFIGAVLPCIVFKYILLEATVTVNANDVYMRLISSGLSIFYYVMKHGNLPQASSSIIIT